MLFPWYVHVCMGIKISTFTSITKVQALKPDIWNTSIVWQCNAIRFHKFKLSLSGLAINLTVKRMYSLTAVNLFFYYTI